jgi:hypothetical protein
MAKLGNRSVMAAALVLLLAAGLSLVAYDAWARPMREGAEAVERGDLRAALDRFKAAEARFDRLPLAKRLFASDYSDVLVHEAWLLYRLGSLDETIERAAADSSGRLRFWSGCALAARARAEEKPEAVLGWLVRAEDEFRKALELSPEDWDAKFNYELTGRLVADLRKQPKREPSTILKLLRPQRESRPDARRIG